VGYEGGRFRKGEKKTEKRESVKERNNHVWKIWRKLGRTAESTMERMVYVYKAINWGKIPPLEKTRINKEEKGGNP